jgi:hypothetical protein
VLLAYKHAVVFFYRATCPHCNSQKGMFGRMALRMGQAYTDADGNAVPLSERTAFAAVNCEVYVADCARYNKTADGVPVVHLYSHGNWVEQYPRTLPAQPSSAFELHAYDDEVLSHPPMVQGTTQFVQWLAAHDIAMPDVPPEALTFAKGKNRRAEGLDMGGIRDFKLPNIQDTIRHSIGKGWSKKNEQ